MSNNIGKGKKVDKLFFKESAHEVAPKLLGNILCRKINNEIYRSIITETEAYYGEKDTACHASKGRTKRTEVMYGEHGTIYVYICYGIHNMLNIVTGNVDFPEAILIRGIENFNGPGKLTKYLKIDKIFNGRNIYESDDIWIEKSSFVGKYESSERIGIDYAKEEDRKKKWRFTIKT